MKIISNQSGFVGVAALCLIATATAFVGGAAYLDHSGKGIDFSLINPETADSVGAAGRENRMMAEDFIGGYSDFYRESNRSIESLTSTYLVELDQYRADLKQSEAMHRATLEGQDNLLIIVLLAVCGLMAWLFISAARHPRSVSPGPRNISGTPEAYRLEDGSVLFIDAAGYRMISRPKDAVGMIRNQSGGADIVTLMTCIVACMCVSLVLLLAGGSGTGSGSSADVRQLAETYQTTAAAQMETILSRYAASEAAHRQTLETMRGDTGLAVSVGVVLCVLFVLSIGLFAWFKIQTRKETAPQVVCFVQDHAGKLHRIDHKDAEAMLIGNYHSDHHRLIGNQRGNVRLLLMAGVCFCMGLLIFMVSIKAGIIGGKAQAAASTAPAQAIGVESDLMAVIPVFFRNPKGGRPIEAVFVYRQNGEVIRIDPSKIAVAMQAIGAPSTAQPGAFRQMGGVR